MTDAYILREIANDACILYPNTDGSFAFSVAGKHLLRIADRLEKLEKGLSDEEIEEDSDKRFQAGAKWYREQMKKI